MADYPTEVDLKIIETWRRKEASYAPDTFHGFVELMEYIRRIWAYADAGYWSETTDGDKRIYHISTAGWSGNEDIIYAMRRNVFFWVKCWLQETRGGHFIFEVKEP